jgi:hypothetical protein
MVMSVRLWVLLIGTLVAFVPDAEARNCKTVKGTKATSECRDKAKGRMVSSRNRTGKNAKAKAVDETTPGRLVEFVESSGCKLLASESAVRRMREIDTVGSVTWDGNCVGGLISGAGVLRQEGMFAEGNRNKRFAYYLSGIAQRGIRTGRWTRETFDRFVDSPQAWTSLARVEFVNGVSTGAPRPVPVGGTDQHSNSFRSRILDPESKRAQLGETADALPSLTIADTLSRMPEPAASALASSGAATIAPATGAARSASPLSAFSGTPPSVPSPTTKPTEAASAASVPATPTDVAVAAPAPFTIPATTRPAKPSPATVAATASVASAVPPPVSNVREVAVMVATEMPASMVGQPFAFGTGCYTDTLDGEIWSREVLTAKDRKSMRIVGWGVDDEEKKLSEATYLRLENSNGQRFYVATIPENRPDVAKYLGLPDLIKSGYWALVSAEGMPPGDYEVAILMNSIGRNVLCSNGRKLRI